MVIGWVSGELQLENVGENVVVKFQINSMKKYPKKDNKYDHFFCSAWNNVASRIVDQLSKGDEVLLIGRIETSNFISKRTNQNEYRQIVIVESFKKIKSSEYLLPEEELL